METICTQFNSLIGSAIRTTITPMMLPLIERNLIPDYILRLGIRRELEMELLKISSLTIEQKADKLRDFIQEIKQLPIAIQTKTANTQHYEVPNKFFEIMLGSRMKYSCGYWYNSKTTLNESEINMLELYCKRANLTDHMNIIDLGCGWGSLTLFLAQKYPNSTILAISNSNTQREYILSTAKNLGLNNIIVETGDINTFDLNPTKYYDWADRVLSIEMFEHMKNYELLMRKVSRWLKPGGKLFVHIFAHKEVPGHYAEGWMTENFFTGGTLPCDSLLLYFQNELRIEAQWRMSGQHYQRTLEAWLQRMDQFKEQLLPVLATAYGEENALKWFVNWRLFNMACAEFFGMRNGQEYIISHYLFNKPIDSE